MRINIYAEELTDRIEVVTKNPANHPGETFYGIRLYLASPDELHVTPDDDDSSAITVWVPWTRVGGNDFARVERIFAALANATLAASEDDL